MHTPYKKLYLNFGSNDIKNLEIYYRCIVMFFERNRQKYDFLLASAEKFTELAKLLAEEAKLDFEALAKEAFENREYIKLFE